METKIGFNSDAVKQAAEEYEKVELPKEYRELMNSLSFVMSPYIGMSDGAIRGFISRAIIKWQIKNNIKIKSVLDMSLSQRQKMMKEGMGILYEILLPVLKTPEDQLKLKKAIDAGYDAYLKKFINQIK